MLYLDFNWDVSSRGIILDEEFNSDKLGWKHGDLFRFVNINGRQILQKMDPLETFVRGHKANVQEE